MIRLVFGFLAGTFYGAITTIEVPDGILSKAAAILKMIFFS